MKLYLFTFFLAAALVSGESTEDELREAAFSCSCNGQVIDRYLGFEVDADGNQLQAGDRPGIDFDLPYGVDVIGQRIKKGKVPASTGNDLVIFNTEMPTGMDEDLGVDGEMKVLILHENDDFSDPDDAQ